MLATYVSITRIGYIALFAGDPESVRLELPAILGVWHRLSVQLGILVGLMAAAQICSRRADRLTWVAGLTGIACASLYGNRFFIALPVAATFLLWDQARQRVSLRVVVIAFMVGVPSLSLIGFWRYQKAPIDVLGPAGLVAYGTLLEFRDLAWSIDHYSGGAHPLLHGSTLGGLVVPMLPGAVWSALGVDKAAVYANSNAVALAREMGQDTPQRIGLYGELFINFGWLGAFVGAVIYGAFLGCVDSRFLALDNAEAVRAIVLAVVAVVVVYAQMGQWDMDTTAVTSTCYPILLLALVAARRYAPQ